MDLAKSKSADGFLNRIRTVRSTGAVSGNLKLSPGAMISGIRMIAGLFPRRCRIDRELQDSILRAFVVTVIPGADPDSPDLIRMYHDTDYPFAPFTGFLVFDILRRGARLYRSRPFTQLTADQRTSVIADAMSADEIISRLYRAAILMAQVSYFAGIYSPERGCELIDFPGKNSGFTLAESSYTFATDCFGAETTPDGNPP